MTGPKVVKKTNPEEAFTALADETRIAILRALWGTEGHVATFSKLREAVGIRDSGQFNYHLDKLLGLYVAKTDDGYELTEAGTEINGAIESGAYTMQASIEPIALDQSCLTCGDRRTLYYEGETVRIECESCPINSEFVVPPSVFIDVDREAVPTVAGQYLRSMFNHLDAGFCWYCDGRVESVVEPAVDPSEDIPDDVSQSFVDKLVDFPFVVYECNRCGVQSTTGLRHALLDRREVVEFHLDNGMDIDDRSIWEVANIGLDRASILDREPVRAAVTYSLSDETLSLVVNENCTIIERN